MPDDPAAIEGPEASHRTGGWPFWLTVGALSGYWAEVTCGSSPLIFASIWGLCVTLPLYSIHLWALGGWALRRGRNHLVCLYLAGTVFGLYEAYITKVLWSPPWNSHPIRLGGVALLEFMLLVFFWHPVMAFVVPVLAAERWLTRSRTLYNQLPRCVRALLESREARPWLGVTLGFVQGAVTPPAAVVLSLASVGAALFGTAAWWRKGGVPESEVSELLPRGRPLIACWTLIALFYLICGPLMREEALPGLGSQVTIWLCYSLLILLTAAAINKARAHAPPPTDHTTLSAGPDRRFLIPLALSALGASLLHFIVPVIGPIVLVLVWIVAIPTGCRVFYGASHWAMSGGTASGR